MGRILAEVYTQSHRCFDSAITVLHLYIIYKEILFRPKAYYSFNYHTEKMDRALVEHPAVNEVGAGGG